MLGHGAPSGQGGVALEPGFVRYKVGSKCLWEEERPGVYTGGSGLLRREPGTPARAEGGIGQLGQRISYFSVTVTEQQGQGDLKKKAFNWLTVSEGSRLPWWSRGLAAGTAGISQLDWKAGREQTGNKTSSLP